MYAYFLGSILTMTVLWSFHVRYSIMMRLNLYSLFHYLSEMLHLLAIRRWKSMILKTLRKDGLSLPRSNWILISDNARQLGCWDGTRTRSSPRYIKSTTKTGALTKISIPTYYGKKWIGGRFFDNIEKLIHPTPFELLKEHINQSAEYYKN